MCDFPVIIWFGFYNLCDNKIKSRLVPFNFQWHVLPCCPWGKRFLDCVWVRLLPMGSRDHMQERTYLTALFSAHGGEKNLEGMGEAVVHGAKSLLTREDNIMPVVNGWIPWPVYVVVWYICDNLLYVRYYGFGNYIVGAHRLLYIVSWYYFEKFCVLSFNHSCHIIIENDFVGFR